MREGERYMYMYKGGREERKEGKEGGRREDEGGREGEMEGEREGERGEEIGHRRVPSCGEVGACLHCAGMRGTS